MFLEINSEEKKYLEQVLGRYLSDLYREIDHTDSREYREELKNQEGVLKVLKNKLQKGDEALTSGLS